MECDIFLTKLTHEALLNDVIVKKILESLLSKVEGLQALKAEEAVKKKIEDPLLKSLKEKDSKSEM